jgi:hypothetical protein
MIYFLLPWGDAPALIENQGHAINALFVRGTVLAPVKRENNVPGEPASHKAGVFVSMIGVSK